jgi:protein subunit release factor B
MTISDKKRNELIELMNSLHIKEHELQEKFILASGSGGQKVQKTHSGVILKHLPTNIQVKVTKSRNREENRFFARRLLCEKFQEKIMGQKSTKQLLAEKKAKQKKRRTRRQKDKNF